MPKTRCADIDVVWDVAGPIDAPPVLMINGLGAARAGWSLQVEALGRRYRVFSYDNRDVGETGTGSNPRSYGIDRFADDAANLVEELEIGPIHVIGASMGGAIAQELALRRPDLTRSVQIVCSWARTDHWLADLFGQWKAIFAEMGPLAFARDSWLWVFTHRWYRDPDHLDTLIAATASYPFPQTAAMFGRQAEAAIGFDALARIGHIAAPVHIVAGEEDILTPPRFSQELQEAIPGSILTLLPDVGHGMFWETPERFNSALLGFLDQHQG